MEYDLTTLVAILAVVVIASALVGWLVIRMMKARMRRDMNDDDASSTKDSAFSAVETTRALAEAFRNQGRDTMEADVLLYKAESAYEAGDWFTARELCGRAKDSLIASKPVDLLSAPPPVRDMGSGRSAQAPVEVPSAKVREMPSNYMESKFMLSKVESLAETADDETWEKVKPDVEAPQAAFDAEDYTAALASALKARRVLEGQPAQASLKAKYGEVLPQAKKEDGPAASVPMREVGLAVCQECGADLDDDDEFCPVCGRRKAVIRVCPSCSREALDGDKFCRKCGAPMPL